MKKVCIVAQFPPPIHGLSKAVETLYESNLKDTYILEKIDITNNKKILLNIAKIVCSKADLFYFTISQSRGGNLRDLIILKLISIKKKKCLVHLHGGYYRKLVDQMLPEWQKKQNYNAISKIDGAIVLGSSLKYIFEGMLPNNKIFIVPNCVDNQYLMSEIELRQKIKKIEDDKILHVLYLSNFIKSKGYPLVLELAKKEKTMVDLGEEKKFHYDFAGKFFSTDDENYFYNYIKEHNLEEFVTYHGVVSGKEKNNLLKLCAIFALPTYYPNEGQPISILEAMGNGLFIFSTNHAGIPDIVHDNRNGLLLNVGDNDSNNITIKLRNSMSNKRDLVEVLLNNRKDVEENYMEEKYIENLRSVFSMLLLE